MSAVPLKLRCDEKNVDDKLLSRRLQDETLHLFLHPQRNDVDRSGEVKL